MAEHMADLDVLLTVRGELGPVLGDFGVGVELAAVDEGERGESSDDLGDGPDGGDGASGPGLCACIVCVAAPELDNGLAVDVDADVGTKFLAGSEVLLKEGYERREGRMASALDLCHCDLASRQMLVLK